MQPAKTLTAVLAVATLALPYAGVAGAAAQKKTVITKKATGQGYEADRWGTVTVNVTVRVTRTGTKKTVKYTNLGGNYSYHTDRSQYIMSQALPLLRQEFLQAQSANVELISGATDTSQAFQESLQSALSKLKV